MKSSRTLSITAILASCACVVAATGVAAHAAPMRLNRSARIHAHAVLATQLNLVQEASEASRDLGIGKIYPAKGKIEPSGPIVRGPRSGLPQRSPSRPPAKRTTILLASLRSLEGDMREVTFRPTEISINRSIKWQQSDPTRTRLAYNAKEPALLKMEFTVTSPTDVYADFIRTFEELTREDDALHRPPLCRFAWGNSFPIFRGVIETLNVKYTRFAADGTPLSAVVNIQMKEADSLMNRKEAGKP